MDKKELRTFLLQYRDKMDKMDAAAHSRNICQELKRCFRGDRVMVYLATGNECDPEEYYEDLLHSHSSVYVPSGWKNCSLIEKDKLCALPIYLDNIKEEIKGRFCTK